MHMYDDVLLICLLMLVVFDSSRRFEAPIRSGKRTLAKLANTTRQYVRTLVLRLSMKRRLGRLLSESAIHPVPIGPMME